jgi:hypothetical protein
MGGGCAVGGVDRGATAPTWGSWAASDDDLAAGKVRSERWATRSGWRMRVRVNRGRGGDGVMVGSEGAGWDAMMSNGYV